MLTPQQLLVIEALLQRERLLVQADTSFGKTLVFLKIFDELLAKNPDTRAVFITDTRVRDSLGVVSQYLQWRELLPNLIFDEKAGKIMGLEIFAYSNLKGLVEVEKCDFLCLDESHKIKDASTIRFKSCKSFIDRLKIPHRLMMTATPIGNSMLDLWTQIYMVDKGETLGNRTKFLGAYFDKLQQFGYVKYKEKPEAREQIFMALKPIYLAIETERPAEFEEFFISFELELETQKIYEKLKEDGIFYSKMAADTALKVTEILGKIRQFTFGLVKVSQNDKLVSVFDEEKVIRKKKDPMLINHDIANLRFQKLHSIIEKTLPHSNLLVFTHYIAEGEFLEQQLKQLYPDKNVVRLAGGTKAEEFEAIIKDWNDRKIHILICNPASVGTGLNLQYGGFVIIWYTSSFSYITQYQANSRLIRYGQTEKVRIYYIVCKNTVDEDIARALAKKEDIKNITKLLFKEA